jgi:hypothetical protein
MVISDGWDYGAMVTENYQTLPDDISFDNGCMGLSPQLLSKYGVDTGKSYQTEFKNVKDFEVDCDNMAFSVDICIDKITVWRGCYRASIWLLGTQSDLILTLTNEGCSHFSRIEFSDFNKKGKYDDLTSLGQNLFDWQNIRIETRQKKAKIYSDSKLIYELVYNKPVGEIKCLHIHFEGSGSIDNPLLLDGYNDTILYNSFDE